MNMHFRGDAARRGEKIGGGFLRQGALPSHVLLKLSLSHFHFLAIPVLHTITRGE